MAHEDLDEKALIEIGRCAISGAGLVDVTIVGTSYEGATLFAIAELAETCVRKDLQWKKLRQLKGEVETYSVDKAAAEFCRRIRSFSLTAHNTVFELQPPSVTFLGPMDSGKTATMERLTGVMVSETGESTKQNKGSTRCKWIVKLRNETPQIPKVKIWTRVNREGTWEENSVSYVPAFEIRSYVAKQLETRFDPQTCLYLVNVYVEIVLAGKSFPDIDIWDLPGFRNDNDVHKQACEDITLEHLREYAASTRVVQFWPQHEKIHGSYTHNLLRKWRHEFKNKNPPLSLTSDLIVTRVDLVAEKELSKKAFWNELAQLGTEGQRVGVLSSDPDQKTLYGKAKAEDRFIAKYAKAWKGADLLLGIGIQNVQKGLDEYQSLHFMKNLPTQIEKVREIVLKYEGENYMCGFPLPSAVDPKPFADIFHFADLKSTVLSCFESEDVKLLFQKEFINNDPTPTWQSFQAKRQRLMNWEIPVNIKNKVHSMALSRIHKICEYLKPRFAQKYWNLLEILVDKDSSQKRPFKLCRFRDSLSAWFSAKLDKWCSDIEKDLKQMHFNSFSDNTSKVVMLTKDGWCLDFPVLHLQLKALVDIYLAPDVLTWYFDYDSFQACFKNEDAKTMEVRIELLKKVVAIEESFAELWSSCQAYPAALENEIAIAHTNMLKTLAAAKASFEPEAQNGATS